jgi:tRNA pseudouridine55 synthase
MARARGDAGLDGFINLCKPAGPTSHDLVSAVRRRLGTRRVGHAGTLDPLAEGVLPLALGRATRLVDLLAEADKEYQAEIELGRRTSTDDAEGELLSSRPVPRYAAAELDAALAGFVGQIQQVPPGFSALKVGGQRAYSLARAGQRPVLAARAVQIFALERRAWEWPVLTVRLRCSKGTYVRALARDLGERLGVGGALRRLVRLRVGSFTLAEAVSLEELDRLGERAVLPPDAPLVRQPAIVLSAEQEAHLRHGRAWTDLAVSPGLLRAYTLAGDLAGLIRAEGGRCRPKLSFLD